MFRKGIFRHSLRWFCMKVGDSVSVRRKITPEDVKSFADLTNDRNPIHSDGKNAIVHGAFLNGLVSGVIGTVLPGFGTVVVRQDLKFPKPCYVGDEVTVEVKVKSVRKMIEVAFYVLKGDGQIVLEGSAKLLIPNIMKFRSESNAYGHDYAKTE